MIELKKALIYSEDDDIVIVEPKQSVEIDSNDIDEGLKAIEDNYPNTKLLLFNHIHSYSYTFKAMFRLKKVLRFKAVASVIGDVHPKTPMTIMQFVEMFQIKVPIKFFINKEEAIQWLRNTHE